MLENIKLFATDTDRSTYEEGDNYIEPYVSLVDGVDNVNYDKLIIGTINNPSIGTVNVKNGDYFDRISVQKRLVIGTSENNKMCSNFLCFPFDITINELREALGSHKLSYIYFASQLEIKFPVLNTGEISWVNAYSNIKLNVLNYNDNTVIQAGTPILVIIDYNKQSEEQIQFLFTFKNKTISFGDSLISYPTQSSNWYFVGSPFRNRINKTGLSTASQGILTNNGLLAKSTSMNNSTCATCSGWIEYRGPVPSE